LSTNTDNQIFIYISPPCDETLKTGSIIKITLIYSMEFITPLGQRLGNTPTLRSDYYTRIEQPLSD
ncbi:hypothetical protein GGQ84_002791, partial [Desulfitispora alkaliphila]|uniref:hypothetical protein n=1 Tax=Desulfitispora alkaliphila TaxID=622674 RepID=UPI003D239CCE